MPLDHPGAHRGTLIGPIGTYETRGLVMSLRDLRQEIATLVNSREGHLVSGHVKYMQGQTSFSDISLYPRM